MASDLTLKGIHHVSAITARASYNVQFYTQTLGLRLVAKTVNQDDTSSYHLFYADAHGTPGTDLTFFDIAQAREQRAGAGLITGTSLRVRGQEALQAWATHFDAVGVRRTAIHERAGRAAITFYDQEDQTLHLVDDSADVDRVPDTTPWKQAPVEAKHAIQGLGPVEITVDATAGTRDVLTEVFGLRDERAYTVRANGTNSPDGGGNDAAVPHPPETARVFSIGEGGSAAELHVIETTDAPRGWLGRGGVHHVALRTPNEDTIAAWRERIAQAGLNVSPIIDRHYFTSIYVRVPGGILIEIATDTGAAFPVDEADAGKVTLPPALEPDRASIEANLAPIEPATTPVA
ncbi:MAG: VOC family protein [Longimonas sp.]|uniref:VOC family protein n=1 Tax=Longimonas sp. TaxID=2039626 RepID=UPI003344D961